MMTEHHSRLSSAPLRAVVPAADLARAERFYGETLGLQIEKNPEAAGFTAFAGHNTALFVYQTDAVAGTATQALFQVEALEAVLPELRERGVTFEEYDMPGLKTVDGIAETGGMKTAWFKDSEGNTLAISER